MHAKSDLSLLLDGFKLKNNLGEERGTSLSHVQAVILVESQAFAYSALRCLRLSKRSFVPLNVHMMTNKE